MHKTRQVVKDTQEPSTPDRRLRRPSRVTLVAWLVLTIASVHLIRFIQAILQWDFQVEVAAVSPLYLVSTGVIWVVVAFPLGWGLLYGKTWSARVVFYTALVYTLYYWLDRIFVAQDILVASRSSPVPFMIGFNFIILAFMVWALRSKKGMAYFRRD